MNKIVEKNKSSGDFKNSYDNMLEYLKIKKKYFINWGIQEIINFLPKPEKVEKEWKYLKERIEITYKERKQLKTDIKELNKKINSTSSKISYRKRKNQDVESLRSELESLRTKKAEKQEKLKSVYIRGYSQDKKETWENLKQIYQDAEFQCDIKRDRSNNGQPPQLLERITGYTKTKSKKLIYIRGYKVSHMWGFTKNVYLFNCPWNVIYTPTAIDPFTGHELPNSQLKQDMQKEIADLIFEKYYSFIKKYNDNLKNNQNIQKFTQNCQKKIRDLKPKIDQENDKDKKDKLEKEKKFYEDMLGQFQPLTKENMFSNEDSDDTDE